MSPRGLRILVTTEVIKLFAPMTIMLIRAHISTSGVATSPPDLMQPIKRFIRAGVLQIENFSCLHDWWSKILKYVQQDLMAAARDVPVSTLRNTLNAERLHG
ncbi:hypothetical protein AMECASPLE_003360 [Ameca splendens]|uniref:Uncharacterized protein n=1 Tax=Ameca splendens TaxID=208324 RepID=A0ABV0ZJD8_9TELE